MRPRELKIEGFTCFADPVTIDFSNLDVFVITGPTGAGKTTIIDALCYALYGKIPRHSETTQLMSHNRDHLHVALEFSAGEALYRVVRSINVTRKTARNGTERVTRAPSPVQFERFIDGEWVPAEGRVRAIDEEIERIVGLDFDAFQRCVVLPQGRFQEFLTGDRKKRQDILKDLLDIGIYEQVMAAANLRARLHAQGVAQFEQHLRDDFADATEEALDANRRDLEAAAPALETAKRRREQLTKAGELAVTVMGARGRERERAEQHAATVKEIEQAKTLGEAGAQQLDGLRKDVVGAEAQLKKLTYDAALHRALHVARDKAQQLDATRSDLAKAREAAADGTGVERAEAAVAVAAAARKQAEERRLVAVEQREAAQRADAASHVRSGLKAGDACPVCGGTVGKLPKAAASALPAHEKAVKEAEAGERKATEGHRAAELALERARQQAQAATATAERLDADVAQAEKALAELLPQAVKSDAGAIATALAEQDKAGAEAEALNAAVASLRKQLDELEPLVAQSGQSIAGLQAKAAQLEEEAGAAKEEGDRAMTGLRKLASEGEWKDVLALIDQKQNPQAKIGSMLKDAVTEADTLTARKTSLEERVRVIEQKIERAGELRESLEAARTEGALCKELGLLLRADQFQDYVVSSAMAVLAESATAHLETLHQRFALQVDGGEFQVIDHWQADQVRSARTLSGGETFVVSLALSLALSERLPELRSAAAAALESLFLDEGFGTLDPETLETVIDALEGLRSEDRMVGIVTHVPELAQRIEDRITVVKSPAGSRVEVRR